MVIPPLFLILHFSSVVQLFFLKDPEPMVESMMLFQNYKMAVGGPLFGGATARSTSKVTKKNLN